MKNKAPEPLYAFDKNDYLVEICDDLEEQIDRVMTEMFGKGERRGVGVNILKSMEENKMENKCEGCGKAVTEEKLNNNDGFCDDCYYWRCGNCEKVVKKEERGWNWGEEPIHLLCLFEVAETICSDCENYLSVLDSIDVPCEDCGGKMRPITKEDKEKIRRKKVE